MSLVVSYVASPDFELNLYASIHSLFQSRSDVDRVKVFSVGGRMPYIDNLTIPVEVEEVENKNKNYFLENKTYVTNVRSKNLVYLDCDTVVLNDVSSIWGGGGSKFIARKDSAYESGEYFSVQKWKALASQRGASSGPYFNSGFLGFRRGAQEEIGSLWKRICREEYEKGERSAFAKFQSAGMIEQMSLSVSVLRKIEDVGLMDEEEHVYGWEVPPDVVSDDAVVYHTGSRGGRHLKYAMALGRRGLVDFSEPVISRATHPLFIKLQAYNLAYRAKEFFSSLRS